jgi:hypothetical protein
MVWALATAGFPLWPPLNTIVLYWAIGGILTLTNRLVGASACFASSVHGLSAS